MMDSILDSLTAEKLYPSGGTNLLDLEELSDGDFLTNVVSSGTCCVQSARLVPRLSSPVCVCAGGVP